MKKSKSWQGLRVAAANSSREKQKQQNQLLGVALVAQRVKAINSFYQFRSFQIWKRKPPKPNAFVRHLTSNHEHKLKRKTFKIFQSLLKYQFSNSSKLHSTFNITKLLDQKLKRDQEHFLKCLKTNVLHSIYEEKRGKMRTEVEIEVKKINNKEIKQLKQKFNDHLVKLNAKEMKVNK